MKDRSVLSKSESRLLKESNFLNSDKVYKQVLDYIEKKDNHFFNNTTKERIKKNKKIWIDIAREEWGVRRPNYLVINPSENREDWERCQLCDTLTKKQYYIKNKTNGTVLRIGGDCLKHFSGHPVGNFSKIIGSEEEAKKYELLLEEFPEIDQILFSDVMTINNFELVIPLYLEDSLKKAQKDIKGLVRNYFKKDILNKNFFQKQIDIYNDKLNKASSYCDSHKNDVFYLSAKEAQIIKNQQPEEYPSIIENIKDGNGKMRPQIISLIKIPLYLNRLVSYYNKNLEGFDIGVRESLYGSFTVDGILEGDKYTFTVSSIDFTQYFLSKITNREGISLKDFLRNQQDKINITSNDTERKLIDVAIYLIDNSSEFQSYNFSFSQLYKSAAKNQLDKKEISKDKANSFVNVNASFKYANIIFTVKKKDLASLGLVLLCREKDYAKEYIDIFFKGPAWQCYEKDFYSVLLKDLVYI